MVLLHKGQRTDGEGEVEGFLTKMWGSYHIVLTNNENIAYQVLEETIEPVNIEVLKTEELSKFNNKIEDLKSHNINLSKENEMLKGQLKDFRGNGCKILQEENEVLINENNILKLENKNLLQELNSYKKIGTIKEIKTLIEIKLLE